MNFQEELFNGTPLRGIEVNDHEFLAVVPFARVRRIVHDPRKLQPNVADKQIAADPDLEDEIEMHALVQRAIEGNKRKNVTSYMGYIKEIVEGLRKGVLPTIHLWTSAPLRHGHGHGHGHGVGGDGDGAYFMIVPDDQWLISIDGETQLTAHFALSTDQAIVAEIRKAHREMKIKIIIHHNLPLAEARQFFRDLNTLSVKPSTSLALAMDGAEPLTKILHTMSVTVPLLVGKIEMQKRQITKRSKKVVTFQGLRTMALCLMKGIAGVQYGAKAAKYDGVDMADFEEVFTEWIKTFTSHFPAEISDRSTYILSSGAVLAAVGALAHPLLAVGPSERPDMMRRMIASLQEVDFQRSSTVWEGIAGKKGRRGSLTVSGAKEVGHTIFAALADNMSATYHQIRKQSKAA